MKVKVRPLIFCGVILFLSYYVPVSLGQSLDTELLNKQVQEVKLDTTSLHLVLSELASKYRIPIGLETSLEGSEVKEDRIIVNIAKGTVEDVLNAIVQATPGYEWKFVDGVINVFPKEARDPLLEDILNTSIRKFVIKQGKSRLSIRTAITDLPEIKSKLKTANLKPLILATNSIDFREAGQGFSLDMRDATIREILNQIIKKSEAKYWLISRYGKSQEFFIINL